MATGKNRKKVLIVGRLPQAGIDLLKTRDDVDYEILTDDTVPSLHPKLKDVNAVTLGGTPFRQAELDAAPVMMVVARLGVGFDSVEIPALNKRKIPLMTTGIANSVSVAEHAAGVGPPVTQTRPFRARQFLGAASQRPAR
jgi:D-3-phosphoglycerate dehydrogenase